jgi:hypothetical protein
MHRERKSLQESEHQSSRSTFSETDPILQRQGRIVTASAEIVIFVGQTSIVPSGLKIVGHGFFALTVTSIRSPDPKSVDSQRFSLVRFQ